MRNENRRRSSGWKGVGIHAAIWMVLVMELFPLWVMLQTSFKDNRLFIQDPWSPIFSWDLALRNYKEALGILLPGVVNSLALSGVVTVGTLFLALMGAYFFARYRMPLSGFLWWVFLVLMLLPAVVNLVPLFSLLGRLKLLNSLVGLGLVGIAGGQVFCMYVLRGFIEEIPRDYFDAAEIDGASHWSQLWRIVVPFCWPVLATLGVLVFVNQWNDFLVPLVALRDPELFPVGVRLIYLDGEYIKRWGVITAAFTFSSLPLLVLFLIASGAFVRGFERPFLR